MLFFKLYHHQFKTDDIILNSEVLNSFFAINSKNLISFFDKKSKKIVNEFSKLELLGYQLNILFVI